MHIYFWPWFELGLADAIIFFCSKVAGVLESCSVLLYNQVLFHNEVSFVWLKWFINL